VESPSFENQYQSNGGTPVCTPGIQKMRGQFPPRYQIQGGLVNLTISNFNIQYIFLKGNNHYKSIEEKQSLIIKKKQSQLFFCL
jgi:hypothetical protein